MLRRREFLKTAALAASIAHAAPLRKPNVVVLLAGQWSAQSLPAKQGVQFERCYTADPLSGPAQAALITGRFPHGVRLPPDQPSLAEQLTQSGYATALLGNWFSESNAAADAAIDFLRQNKQRSFCLLFASDGDLGPLLRAADDPDTIVVFTACRGEVANSPREASVRVPLLIRYPRLLPARRKYDFLISSVDIMPTLLGLCGVEIPDQVQGQDLSTLIASGRGAHPESVYVEGQLGEPGEWRMLVRGLDKLVVDRDLNVTHLYNLGQDPSESENLALDAAQELKRDEMKALLKDWMRRTADRMDPSGLKKR